ncbi:MAG: hypothetical protein KF685_03985 [Acidobacteria bacterium]|nr:hypothetical protein [Acidobacteriota bacterium]
MIAFFKYFLPFTYFAASRVKGLQIFVYHVVIEWLPAVMIVAYFSGLSADTAVRLGLYYLAFISIYEIGYLTNDFIAEKKEHDPRGRSKEVSLNNAGLLALIASRIAFFLLITWALELFNDTLWWAFYVSLSVSFFFHNYLANQYRLPTFTVLSIFRFFAPFVFLIQKDALLILLPVVIFNYSLFRLLSYGASKGLVTLKNREAAKFKMLYYASILPLSVFITILFSSPLPVAATLYYLAAWLLQGFAASLVSGQNNTESN